MNSLSENSDVLSARIIIIIIGFSFPQLFGQKSVILAQSVMLLLAAPTRKAKLVIRIQIRSGLPSVLPQRPNIRTWLGTFRRASFEDALIVRVRRTARETR